MAAGKIVQGLCVDSSAALDMALSYAVPVHSAGSPSYTSYLYNNSGLLTKATYQDGVLVLTENLGTLPMPDCDTTQSFFDGAQLGWGIVAAMVAAWLFLQLRRAL